MHPITRWSAALPLVAYAVAAVLSTWPLAGHLTDRLAAPVGPGDPYLNLWILGWGLQTVVSDPAAVLTGSVFNANIFHPAPGTLAYSDHLLLQSTVLAPLFAATGNVVLCYNVLFLLSLVASAWAMHVCARALAGSEGGAYLAGLAWGFGSYRFAHLLHLQLQSLYFLPLTILFLHRTAAGRRRVDALVLGVLVGLQAISSVYYAVIGGIGLLVVAAALSVTALARGRGRFARRLALAAGVGAVLTLPVAVVYVRVQVEQGFGRSLFEAAQGAARVGSYLQAPEGNVLYGRTGLLRPDATAPGTQRGPERELFPGFALVGLATAGVALGWRRGARPLVAGMVALAVVGGVLSLGPDGLRPVYAWFHEYVFGFQAVRAPARFAVLVILALSMLAAVGWRELSAEAHGSSRRVRRTALAAVFMTAVLEGAHVPTGLAQAPSLRTPTGVWLSQAPGSGAVAVLPVGIDVDATPAMVQSLEHRRRIVNGYSGQRPEFYPALVDVLSTFPSDEALQALHDRDVQYVVTPRAVPGVGDAPPLVSRAVLADGIVYELVWTPEIDARLAVRTPVAPPAGPLTFRVGERSEYVVTWESGTVLEAGRIVLTVEGSGLRFRAAATTSPLVSRFFAANDWFLTETDAQLLPVTHEREQREGTRQLTRAYVFDREASVVRVAPTLDEARREGATTLPLEAGARDALAALYYVRTLGLEPGRQLTIPINEGGRGQRLDLNVVGLESIVVQGAPTRAWRIEPVLRQRVERRRPPTAVIWLSDDARRVPLAVDLRAAFGRVRLELVAHEGGR